MQINECTCIAWWSVYVEVEHVPLQGTFELISLLLHIRQHGPRPVVPVELLCSPAVRSNMLFPVRLVPVCLFCPATFRTSCCAPAGKRSPDHQPPKWVLLTHFLYVYNTPASARSSSYARVTLWEPPVAASMIQCDYSDSCPCKSALMRIIAQGWRKLARRLTRSTVRCSVCGLQWYQVFSFWRQSTYR